MNTIKTLKYPKCQYLHITSITWNPPNHFYRFDFVMEAIHKAEAETDERKGHYLNVTAPPPNENFKCAEHAKELGAPIIMHD